jgi:hypothetical protein
MKIWHPSGNVCIWLPPGSDWIMTPSGRDCRTDPSTFTCSRTPSGLICTCVPSASSCSTVPSSSLKVATTGEPEECAAALRASSADTTASKLMVASRVVRRKKTQVHVYVRTLFYSIME